MTAFALLGFGLNGSARQITVRDVKRGIGVANKTKHVFIYMSRCVCDSKNHFVSLNIQIESGANVSMIDI